MLCLASTQQHFVSVRVWRHEFITFDDLEFFFKAEIASFTCAIAGWAWWKDTPLNKVVNVIVFKSPDVFAEFGRLSVFCVLEWCSVVSVSCLEIVFCKSDVRFSGAIVLTCDSGLALASVEISTQQFFYSKTVRGLSLRCFLGQF